MKINGKFAITVLYSLFDLPNALQAIAFFIYENFEFHQRNLQIKISTTTEDSNTGFLGENPTHKGFFRTS